MLISKATTEANYGVDPVARKINNSENAIFKITDTSCMFQFLLCQKKMTQNF